MADTGTDQPATNGQHANDPFDLSGAGSGSDDGQRDEGDVSQWGSQLPSGWRGRVDEDEAAKTARRDPHQQHVTKNTRNHAIFRGAQFVAHVGQSMKFKNNGDLVIELVVPYQFKHLAIPLSNVHGLPLSIDVQIWHPYVEASAKDQ